jgi:hypothetical protein
MSFNAVTLYCRGPNCPPASVEPQSPQALTKRHHALWWALADLQSQAFVFHVPCCDSGARS